MFVFKRSSLLSLLHVILVIGSLEHAVSVERATYRFTTCGSRDREGPTMMECTQHYCNNGSLVCGHLLDEGTRGSQIFVVPRSGNYTVTIAGASGGHGVCSNYSGLGVIARNTVQFRRGERLRILVGQQGVSACDGHQDVDVCQLANDRMACENIWKGYFPDDVFFSDGGGGGGGASLINIVDTVTTGLPIAIAPGGGGAAAIYDVTGFFGALVIRYNDSDDLEAIYQNFSIGHAYETHSMHSNGTFGTILAAQSAGPGAGYFEPRVYRPQPFDPDALIHSAFGGEDCNEYVRADMLFFPDTHGGFGGGGGGCEGGGGGGGYTGGTVFVQGEVVPGEGGYSWPNPPWPLIGYNDGDGYVELFLESCGCTYYCNMSNESSFECSCPPDTSLAPNGLDCYKEEGYFLESEEDPISFLHSSYGVVTADVKFLNETIYIYGGAVVFSDESSSHSCAVLFLGDSGELATTTKFINRSLSSKLQALELFTAITVIDSGNISVNLSKDKEFVLQEPVPLAVVVTYGIGGDCIVEELLCNISTDEIYSYDSDLSVNLSSSDTLQTYLSALSEDSVTDRPTTSDQSSLTAGVIAAIVISVGLVFIVTVVVISVLSIKLYQRSKHSKSFDFGNGGHRKRKTTVVRVVKVHNKHLIKTNEQVNPWYEWITSTYEVIDDSAGSYAHLSPPPVKYSADSLRYGLHSPLQDYYHFNCSRKKDDWSYDRTKLTYMREIGEGQFGKVLLMSAKEICGIKGPVLVAVKTLTSRNPKDIELFSKELDLMKRFIHPNIVSLLGHCKATSDGAPLIILELMQYGDLRWFLRVNRPDEVDTSLITENVAISIVTDVASGLEYLATNKYVHRDVAARNCLIGADFKAKLSDFGLARGVHETDYYRVSAQTLLPVKWLAPESLLFGKFTTMSDVWSYGVLVWEVATYGEVPHEHFHLHDIVEMANNKTLVLNSPRGCPGILAGLIDKCTKIQPKDRPTFTEILQYCGKEDSSSLDSNVSEHD